MNIKKNPKQEHSVLKLHFDIKIAILIPVGVVNVSLLLAIEHS